MARPEVNPKWFQLDHMSELAEYLQSVPSFELTKRVAAHISEEGYLGNPRRIVIENFIMMAKSFMRDIFDELRSELEHHSLNYPYLTMRIPFVREDLN